MHYKERDFSLPEAFDRIKKAYKILNLKYVLTEIATKPAAYLCELIDISDQKTYLGFGKGNKEEATVGALFEALEHYISNMNQVELTTISLKKMHHLQALFEIKSPITQIIKNQKDQDIGCLEYTSLTEKGVTAPFPIFLSTVDYVTDEYSETRKSLGDTFNYYPLYRYTNGSGTAIGSTKTEALVHAISEVIERDSISFFLLSTFFKINSKLKTIAVDSLPNALQALYKQASTYLENPIYIYHLPNEFNIPCYMAWSEGIQGEKALVGYGCSLDAEYAVYRAITELVQSVAKIPTITEEEINNAKQEWQTGITQFKGRKRLIKCALLDLKPLLSKNTIQFENETSITAETPKKQLQILRDKLKDKGFNIWYYENALAKKANVSLVHIVIPGMENFFMTTFGKPVIPNERGMAYLTTNLYMS